MLNVNDNDVLVIEAARTAFGRYLGGLKDLTTTELAVTAARGAIAKAGVNPNDIDKVILGNVLQSSSDAAYLSRHVALDIDAPIASDALTVSRACGSGLESIIQAAKSILLTEAQTVLAGGTENMSMTPYVLRGAREGWRMGQQQVEDFLMQSLFDSKAGCVIGETIEVLAKQYQITRAEADAATLQGQQKSYDAQQKGIYAEEIIVVNTKHLQQAIQIDRDESLRPNLTADQLAKLTPLFNKNGIVTAGNSTGLTDGAAMAVICSGKKAKAEKLSPLGRIIAWGVAGVPPKLMGIGPVPATDKALKMAGLSINDMDVIELNDSFAVQYLAVQKILSLDSEKVNPNGGAIALGHPMGATGTRLVISALYHLRRTGKRYGLCTVCVGGGQGIAVVVENLSF